MKIFSGQTFCFLGLSGAGKDTIAKLLTLFLEKEGVKVIVVSTGNQGRILKEKPTAIGRLANQRLEAGSTFPSWLATSLWLSIIEDVVIGDEVLIFPSTPRSVAEANTLDEVMGDIARPQPIPVYINVSEEEARKRLLARGREDDTLENINHRLSWFGSLIVPVIENYGKRTIEIDGHGDSEKYVFPRLLKILNNL